MRSMNDSQPVSSGTYPSIRSPRAVFDYAYLKSGGGIVGLLIILFSLAVLGVALVVPSQWIIHATGTWANTCFMAKEIMMSLSSCIFVLNTLFLFNMIFFGIRNWVSGEGLDARMENRQSLCSAIDDIYSRVRKVFLRFIGIINIAFAIGSFVCVDLALKWEAALRAGPHQTKYKTNQPMNFDGNTVSHPRKEFVAICGILYLSLGVLLIIDAIMRFSGEKPRANSRSEGLSSVTV